MCIKKYINCTNYKSCKIFFLIETYKTVNKKYRIQLCFIKLIYNPLMSRNKLISLRIYRFLVNFMMGFKT